MFWNKREEKRMTYGELNNFSWSTNLGAQSLGDVELKEKTYYSCIKILSESVAKMPCELMQNTTDGKIEATKNPLFDLIRTRPNPFMSGIDFWKCLEANRQHYGESAAFIARDNKGKVTGLYPIKITKFVVDNIGLLKSTKTNPILVYYTAGATGQEYTCLYSDIIHLKGFTLDGLTSLSVRENLQSTLQTNKLTQDYQAEVFSNGGTNKIALQMMLSDIKDPKEIGKIQTQFNNLFSSKGRVFTIPVGYQATPLNVSLADNQFMELKKLNAKDIASVFGIPSYLLGDFEGYNNNSIEQASLSYLVNTLQILLESIETELNYKLLTIKERSEGYYFNFDETVLLRTDAKTQSEIINGYIQNSVYTPNEARMILGKTKLPDGDELLASSGTLKIKDLYLTAKNNANNTTK